MKNFLFTSVICLLTSHFCLGQVDMGLPSITGRGGVANAVAYDWECLGINPSNLGWKKNHRFSLTAAVFGVSMQSGALDYQQLKTAFWHPGDTFSLPDKKAYAELFSNTEGLNLHSNMTWLAFSLKIPKVGGLALNLRDRTAGHVRMNKNAAEIFFLGMDAPIFKDTVFWMSPKNISTVFDGSKVGFIHYRELNIAYGTKLFGIGGTRDSSNVSFYGGVGFKYLWGMGNFAMVAENGVLQGHSAFTSKYGIQYGNVKGFTPEKTSGLFASVGQGTAFDWGLGVGIGKIKITLSGVDNGKITWDKNVLVANDTLLPDTSQFNFEGVNSWNMSEQAEHMFNDSGLIDFKPGPAYETKLLSRFRVGFGWQVSKRMVMGADMVFPMGDNPANLQKAFYAIGTEIELASNLRVAFGFAGNSTYKFSVPLGITLCRVFKVMEIGIATNDILTFLAPGPNPNASLSLSLFRINVGEKKK